MTFHDVCHIVQRKKLARLQQQYNAVVMTTRNRDVMWRMQVSWDIGLITAAIIVISLLTQQRGR